MKAALIGGLVVAATAIALHYSKPAATRPAFAVIQSGRGEWKRVQLPDGSSIRLDPGSSVRVPEGFGQRSRELFMTEGEVWYDVAQNSKLPFVVHTGAVSIRVLGTSFNIRNIQGIGDEAVLVKDGKVQVLHQDSAIGVLTAGRQLTYNKLTDKYRVEGDRDLFARQAAEGWLVLEKASFSDLRELIATRYNMDITDEHHRLAAASFSASFPPNAAINGIMQVVCGAYNLHFTLNHHRILIE